MKKDINKEKLEEIKTLLEATVALTEMSDETVKQLYLRTKKEVLLNASGAIARLIAQY